VAARYFRLLEHACGAASGVSRNHYRARDVAELADEVQQEAKAIMTEPNLGAVRPARRHEGLGLIGLAGVVSVGLAIALWPGERSDNLTPVGVAGSPAEQPRARPAAPVLAADRQAHNAPATDEQRRRFLLLLMMNSAGPLGPYGKIGR
jgi:hypothetical protein